MLRDFSPLKIVFSFPKIPKIFRSTLTGLRTGLRTGLWMGMWVLDANTGLRMGLRMGFSSDRIENRVEICQFPQTGLRTGLKKTYATWFFPLKNRIFLPKNPENFPVHSDRVENRVENWVEIVGDVGFCCNRVNIWVEIVGDVGFCSNRVNIWVEIFAKILTRLNFCSNRVENGVENLTFPGRPGWEWGWDSQPTGLRIGLRIPFSG